MKILARIVTTIYFVIFYRIEAVNIENIPAQGPAIICGNHKSMLDMFFIGYKMKRWIHWMAKEELFRNPVAAFIFRGLGAFPIRRGKGDITSIKTALKHLEEGRIVGIFPQGTRVNPEKRKQAKVKPGAAMIAINTGVPILPVGVVGSYRPFSRVRIVYGEPFKPQVEEGRKPTAEEIAQISAEIMNRIFSLMEE